MTKIITEVDGSFWLWHFNFVRYNTLMAQEDGEENWFRANPEETTTSDAVVPGSQADNGASETDSPGQAIEWTASEFVERHKSPVWYVVLAAITAGLAALVFFAGHDYIATGAVVAIGIIFGVIGARKPRTLQYRLDAQGLSVAGKVYPYRHFKAFSVGREGPLASISLLPLRRFMPVLTVFCEPTAEDRITELVGSYLPLDDGKLDPIDKFLHKIRF